VKNKNIAQAKNEEKRRQSTNQVSILHPRFLAKITSGIIPMMSTIMIHPTIASPFAMFQLCDPQLIYLTQFPDCPFPVSEDLKSSR
jgi:hypothetical protein